jgi:hypothetical protein
VQLYTALQQAQAAPLAELSTEQGRVIATLKHLLHVLEAGGTPFELPAGVDLHTIDCSYAQQVLQAVEPSISATDGTQHAAVGALNDAHDAVAALQAKGGALRCRLQATIAAACMAWRVLPEKVTGLIQPLMAALRRVPEASVHQEVRRPRIAVQPASPCHASNASDKALVTRTLLCVQLQAWSVFGCCKATKLCATLECEGDVFTGDCANVCHVYFLLRQQDTLSQ